MQNGKLVAFPILVVLVLSFAPLASAQLADSPLSSRRTLGYYNPDTGLFEPLRPATQDLEAPAVAPTTGTLVFNFTITLKTALPKNGMLTCGAAGAVIETGYSADETGFGFAKVVSGNTYSCSVSMPYSWFLNSPGTDKIILSYKATVVEGIQVTATNGTAVTVVASSGRGSSQTIASIAVPANGAITTKVVTVTL